MNSDKNYKKDIIPGVVLCIFSLSYMVMIPQIQEFTGLGATPLTNRFIPLLWGGVLLVLALWILLRGLRKRSRFLKAGGTPEKIYAIEVIKEHKEVIFSFVSMFLFAFLLQLLGFILASGLYLFVQILLLTPMAEWKRIWWRVLLIATIAAVALDWIFKMKLNVLLPKGLIGF